MKRCIGPVVVLLAALAPLTARAAGTWETYLRADSFLDLLAEQDTVWCATGQAGLLRYARATQRFESFTRAPGGLASNNLKCLARDRSGRLWVGTKGAGLSYRAADGSRWDLLNRFDGLKSDSILTLTAVGDTVWIGTLSGLTLWNGKRVLGSIPEGPIAPFRSDAITGIVQHGDSLWVSTMRGLYVSRISAGLLLWSSVDENVSPNTNWAALTTDGKALFALTSTGLPLRREFGPAGLPWVVPGSQTLGTTFRMAQDRNTVLISTELGLWRWTGTDWENLASAYFSDNSDEAFIYSAAIDAAGGLFAANYRGVSDQPAGGAWSAPRYPPGPPGNFITNLGLQGDSVYVSTASEGVGRFDGNQWRYWLPVACSGGGCDTTFIAPLYSFALLVDSQGYKWFGQWQIAIERMNDNVEPPVFVHDRYPPGPMDLRTNAWASAEDRDGGRWFGMDTNNYGDPQRTPLGLVYYAPDGRDSLNFRSDSIAAMSGTKVHGLAVDRTNRVWVGFTDKGLQYFDWPANPVQFVTVPGASEFDVQGIVALHDSIYVMTNRDVRTYRRNGAFVDSLLLPAVPATLAVNPLAVGMDRTVYVGTANGLRVRHADGTIEDWTTTNSPLAGNEVQAVRVDPRNGVVWIGTATGMNRYDPHYTPPPPPPVPQLHFTLYPNPAWLTGVGCELRIQGNASRYRGAVFDLNGRRVRRFDVSGTRPVLWDGRDENGELVKPGLFFVHVDAGGSSGLARVVLVR